MNERGSLNETSQVTGTGYGLLETVSEYVAERETLERTMKHQLDLADCSEETREMVMERYRERMSEKVAEETGGEQSPLEESEVDPLWRHRPRGDEDGVEDEDEKDEDEGQCEAEEEEGGEEVGDSDNDDEYVTYDSVMRLLRLYSLSREIVGDCNK
jgi:hypothetical protein